MPRLHAAIAGLALLLAAPAFAQDEPGILSGADATPNFIGSTGLLETPNAHTVGDKGFAVFLTGGSRFNSAGVIVGPIKNLEIGATWLDIDNATSQIIVNAKYTVLNESTFIPGFAVGVVDAFDELRVGQSWYIVASKDIGKLIPLRPFDLRAHLGFGGGIYDEEVFAALEIGIATPLDAIPLSHPRLTFIPEIRNGDVNLGLRLKWRGFAASVALFDFDQIGGGISYTAGLRL